MDRKIIYVDVDDTVADTRGAIVEYYRIKSGDRSTNPKMYDGPKYDILCPKWNREQMTAAFMDPFFFLLLEPLPGAREGLLYLLTRGYDVKFLTAHRIEGRPLKELWIRTKFPLIEDIIMTEPMVPKDNYVGYGIIDDHLHNVANNKSQVRILADNFGLLGHYEYKDTMTDWSQIGRFF